MHQVYRDPRVYLVKEDGAYMEFADYDELCRWFKGKLGLWSIEQSFKDTTYRQNHWRSKERVIQGRIDSVTGSIGHHHKDVRVYHRYPEYYNPGEWPEREESQVEWVIKDADWRTLDVGELKQNILTVKPKEEKKKGLHIYGPRGRRFYEYPEFRKGPWPRTGHARWRFRHYYRRMKTQSIIRDHITMAADGMNHYIRGKRRKKIIPTSWDDYGRSDCYDRSWKACTKKKKQWMK